jgi:hypothetical protein
MGTASTSSFVVLHSLRVKGFATTGVLVELSGLAPEVVEAELRALVDSGHALFRENRSLWQLTPTGKELHLAAIDGDVGDARDALRAPYEVFLVLNERFKELCGEWQLKPSSDGSLEPNDHHDTAYDAVVIDRLTFLHDEAAPVCGQFASVLNRYATYEPRLAAAEARVQAGEHKQFTGVMCDSYHDVWMELHEDLILTLGIDRTKEGSF